MMKKIIRLKDVMNQTGLARSSIYRLMNEGNFPQSIKLSARSVGWLEADITSWIEGRIVSDR